MCMEVKLRTLHAECVVFDCFKHGKKLVNIERGKKQELNAQKLTVQHNRSKKFT